MRGVTLTTENDIVTAPVPPTTMLPGATPPPTPAATVPSLIQRNGMSVPVAVLPTACNKRQRADKRTLFFILEPKPIAERTPLSFDLSPPKKRGRGRPRKNVVNALAPPTVAKACPTAAEQTAYRQASIECPVESLTATPKDASPATDHVLVPEFDKTVPVVEKEDKGKRARQGLSSACESELQANVVPSVGLGADLPEEKDTGKRSKHDSDQGQVASWIAPVAQRPPISHAFVGSGSADACESSETVLHAADAPVVVSPPFVVTPASVATVPVKSKTCEISFGPWAQCLFGEEKSGRVSAGTVVGYVHPAKAFLVKDECDNEFHLMPPRMVRPAGAFVRKRVRNSGGEFQYALGEMVAFTLRDESCQHMERTKAMVLHRVFDGETRWYVVQLDAPHWNPKDPDNWWSGFDVRKEDQMN